MTFHQFEGPTSVDFGFNTDQCELFINYKLRVKGLYLLIGSPVLKRVLPAIQNNAKFVSNIFLSSILVISHQVYF